MNRIVSRGEYFLLRSNKSNQYFCLCADGFKDFFKELVDGKPISKVLLASMKLLTNFGNPEI